MRGDCFIPRIAHSSYDSVQTPEFTEKYRYYMRKYRMSVPHRVWLYDTSEKLSAERLRNRYYRTGWKMDGICRSEISKRWTLCSSTRYLYSTKTTCPLSYLLLLSRKTSDRSWYDSLWFYRDHAEKRRYHRAPSLACRVSRNLSSPLIASVICGISPWYLWTALTSDDRSGLCSCRAHDESWRTFEVFIHFITALLIYRIIVFGLLLL